MKRWFWFGPIGNVSQFEPISKIT